MGVKNWSEELKQEIKNKIPLKRLGNPNDVANAVYFLSSKDASFITGANLDINGGLSMY
ncbi:MAG: SDR family oxidoreductase [Patescibacteria group bacterium]